MDVSTIKSVVLTQIQGTSGLYSLKLQNHIYGCFIVMEDLAQNVVDVSGNILQGSKFTFDLDKQFSDIGIRFGFAMDTKLALDTFTPEYKETWLQCFKDINLLADISVADSIEDALIEVVQQTVKSEDAFFLNALQTGSLPQEWIEVVLKLLSPLIPKVDSDEDIKVSATMVKANTEKPIRKHRRLATTRRAHQKTTGAPVRPKTLDKTRRHIHKN